MRDSGRPPSPPKAVLPSSQSRSRGRSYTTPDSAHFSDANDRYFSRTLSLPSSSSATYPTLDPTLTLLDQPAASQFATTPDPFHTASSHLHAVFPNTPPLSPQSQQRHMWPFIPPQTQPYNALTDMSHAVMSAELRGPTHHPARDAGPSDVLMARQPPRISYSQSLPPEGFTHSPPDPDEAVILEDKRRRNTAASARFRIKKKQKSFDLERTVSDLTSRAGELEKQASDLRRENSWLKEIVIMKGKGTKFGSRLPRPDESSSDLEEDADDKTVSTEDDINDKRQGESMGKEQRNDKKGKAKATDSHNRDGKRKKGGRS